MARRYVRAFIAIIGVVFCFAVFCFVGCSDDEAVPAEIYGVTAIDVYVVYDGVPHYIEPINVLENDEIYYSTSAYGVWRSERILYTTPGEYVVYYKVVRAGCADFISSAKITIERGVLSGIRADDIVCIYDGKPHGVDIVGVRPGDTVSYSIDGENFSAALELVEPGKYTVYYRVSDSYGDYFDDCSVTILPDVSGRYLNAVGGLVTLDNSVAVVNGEQCEFSCGADGCGTIAGDEFALVDGGITLNGERYDRLSDDEYVYKVTVDDGAVFVAASDTAQISVRFDTEQKTAEIIVDDNVMLTEHGVNYCESIGSVEPVRRYDSSDVSAEVRADSGEVTTVNIVTTLRGVRTVEFAPISVIYDGNPHSAAVNAPDAADAVLYFNGEDYVAEPPAFTEPGEYDVNIVVLFEGNLPAFATVNVIILPTINGVYTNATDVIEVAGYTARYNGNTVACEFVDGAWRIDGEAVVVTQTGIAIFGAEFTKCGDGEGVLLIDINGVRTVFVNVSNIVVHVRDGAVEISGNALLREERVAGDVAVTLNGSVINGAVSDGEIVYVFGMFELDTPVAILCISF